MNVKKVTSSTQQLDKETIEELKPSVGCLIGIIIAINVLRKVSGLIFGPSVFSTVLYPLVISIALFATSFLTNRKYLQFHKKIFPIAEMLKLIGSFSVIQIALQVLLDIINSQNYCFNFLQHLLLPLLLLIMYDSLILLAWFIVKKTQK